MHRTLYCQLIHTWLHETRQLLTQGGTYIFLSFAWVAMGIAAFYLGNFFTRNQADMLALFQFLPWIFLVLCPALAMGSWAEDWRRGTAERLLTLPIPPYIHTLAKFGALKTLLFVALLGTFPLVFTLYWLGEPALGPIISGYVGAWLLGLTMLAVALFASQVSLSQASGFVVGVVLLFLMLAGGWGLLTRLLEGLLPYPIIELLIHYSLLDRFRNFTLGLIDLRDLYFFLSLNFTFLALTHILVRVRTHGWKNYRLPILGILIALIGSNAALSRVLIQWDVTPTHLHTLHPTTVDFLKNLQNPVQITLYYSYQNPNVPAPIKQFVRTTEDTLRRIRAHNPTQISILRATPESSIETEQTALYEGIEEIPLPGGEGYYFGLSFTTEGRSARLPIMTPTRARFLEFDLMSMLLEMTKTTPPKIGILTELNLGDDRLRPRFMQDLLDVYDLTILPPGEPVFETEDGSTFDAILIFLTPFFDQETLYALDQYLVQGGKVLLLMDPYLRSAPTPEFQTPDRNADDWAKDHPADLLRSWGVNYNFREIIADTALAAQVPIANRGIVQYPLWVQYVPPYINPELPLTANIQNLLLPEAGHFQRDNISDGLTFEPLLATTQNSQIVQRANLDERTPELAASTIEGNAQERYPAALLTGTFPSTYQNTPQVVRQYYEDFADDPANPNIPPHIQQTEHQGALLMLGDLDFLGDEFALQPVNNFGETILQPANDNLGFFYNALQSLLGDDVLLPLRGRASDAKPFTRIQAMLAQSAAEYQAAEQQLVAELFDVSRRLTQLQTRQENRQVMEAQIEEEIRAFQARELDVKKRLRETRRQLTQDVRTLERTLAALNMFLSPFLLTLFALLFFAHRKKRARR